MTQFDDFLSYIHVLHDRIILSIAKIVILKLYVIVTPNLAEPDAAESVVFGGFGSVCRLYFGGTYTKAV